MREFIKYVKKNQKIVFLNLFVKIILKYDFNKSYHKFYVI